MSNFELIGLGGRNMIDRDSKIWVWLRRVNFEGKCYEFEVKFDPNFEPATSLPSCDLLAGGARMPPYFGVNHLQSAETSRVFEFDYKFPTSWEGDVNLVYADTPQLSLLNSDLRALENARIPRVSDRPGAYYLEILRGTLVLHIEQEISRCFDRLAIALTAPVAAQLSLLSGENLPEPEGGLVIIAERPSRQEVRPQTYLTSVTPPSASPGLSGNRRWV